ncbi:flagellar protein FlgN [Jeotgalibacillus terrae]|uniref:Flagellar protein FlgN n=1 Tax=Jeotgalibacillus terrae TaxID=587735 RepID=A0ABW5ZC22_9BACL|nr:flagellar protein FlgN [Jeotgalibacillus terrae]MBM7577753.1 flagellar biosynthesis/type III secretory pathway chaperone [Jeotgalibacillus terrae]
MPEQSIKTILQQQTKLHRSLLELAHQKTAVIKENNLDQLNQLIKDEQKHIQAISALENKRQQMVTNEDVQSEKDELLQVVLDLKAVNELNQDLLTQSMQLVSLNLDLLMPQPDSMNYSKTNQDDDDKPARSMFDSQA